MHYDVVALTLCHDRPTVRTVLNHVLEHWKPVKACVVLAEDRPTPDVRRIVDEYATHPHVVLHTPSVPVMSIEHGQQWTTVRNEMLAHFDDAGLTADWELNADDDRWFEPGLASQLPLFLTQHEVKVWRAVSLFVWDAAGRVNVRQVHDEPLFGRYYTGDRRAEWCHSQISTRMMDATQSGRGPGSAYLPGYLLDYGTIDPAERSRKFREYCNAGKNSNYVRRYVQPPVLMTIEEIKTKFDSPQRFSEWQHKIHSPYRP